MRSSPEFWWTRTTPTSSRQLQYGLPHPRPSSGREQLDRELLANVLHGPKPARFQQWAYQNRTESIEASPERTTVSGRSLALAGECLRRTPRQPLGKRKPERSRRARRRQEVCRWAARPAEHEEADERAVLEPERSAIVDASEPSSSPSSRISSRPDSACAGSQLSPLGHGPGAPSQGNRAAGAVLMPGDELGELDGQARLGRRRRDRGPRCSSSAASTLFEPATEPPGAQTTCRPQDEACEGDHPPPPTSSGSSTPTPTSAAAPPGADEELRAKRVASRGAPGRRQHGRAAELRQLLLRKDVRRPLAALDRDEGLGDHRVELRPRVRLDLRESFVTAEAGAKRPLRGHRVEAVGNDQEVRGERKVVAAGPVVAGSVEPLPVILDRLRLLRGEANRCRRRAERRGAGGQPPIPRRRAFRASAAPPRPPRPCRGRGGGPPTRGAGRRRGGSRAPPRAHAPTRRPGRSAERRGIAFVDEVGEGLERRG